MKESEEKLKQASILRQTIEDMDEAQMRAVLQKLMIRQEDQQDGAAWSRAVLENELGLSDLSSAEYIHIAPDDSTAGSLKMVLQRELAGGKQHVFACRDNLSYGPLTGIERREGWIDRLSWLGRMHGCDDLDGIRYLDKGYRDLVGLPARVSTGTEVVVWAGGNAAEQTALRFALFLLRDFPGRIRVLDAPAISGKLSDSERFDSAYLKSGELSAGKLRLIWEQTLAHAQDERLLTTEERRSLEREWDRLSSGNSTLRQYRKGRIVDVSEDHYDDYLLETAKRVCGKNRAYRKAARVIGEAIGHSDEPLDDGFLNHRLSSLVYAGKLAFKGIPRQMRMYEVRPNESQPFPEHPIGSPIELAQRQLDCYNAHDLEGFLAVYAEDAKLYGLLDGTLIAEGREAMRERYRQRFEVDKVHAKLVNRMVIGSRVIDHEEVTMESSDRAVHAAAIYETSEGLIRAAWFVNE